jgi:hypothetical protein
MKNNGDDGYGSNDFAGFMLALVLIGIVVFNLGCAFVDLRMASECKNWPSSTGQITRSGDYSGQRGGGYHVYVGYKYLVDGNEFESEKIFVGKNEIGMFDSPSTLVSGLKKGKQVKVFYNPNDPSYAILRTDHSPSVFSYFFYAVFTIAIGAFLLWARCSTVQNTQWRAEL